MPSMTEQCQGSHLYFRKSVTKSMISATSGTGVRRTTLIRVRCQAVGDGGSPQRSYLVKQSSHSGNQKRGGSAIMALSSRHQ